MLNQVITDGMLNIFYISSGPKSHLNRLRRISLFYFLANTERWAICTKVYSYVEGFWSQSFWAALRGPESRRPCLRHTYNKQALHTAFHLLVLAHSSNFCVCHDFFFGFIFCVKIFSCGFHPLTPAFHRFSCTRGIVEGVSSPHRSSTRPKSVIMSNFPPTGAITSSPNRFAALETPEVDTSMQGNNFNTLAPQTPEAMGGQDPPQYLRVFMEQMTTQMFKLNKAITDVADTNKVYKTQFDKVFASIESLVGRIAGLQEQVTQQKLDNEDLKNKFNILHRKIMALEEKPLVQLQETSGIENAKLEHMLRRINVLETSPKSIQTFAEIAQKGVGLPQKPNSAEKPKTKEPKTLKALYPKISREVIVCFDNSASLQTDNDTEDKALNIVNDALAKSPIKKKLFHAARFSLARNLILTMGLHDHNTDFVGSLSYIEDALSFLGKAKAQLRQPWTKFLLHGVPTSLDLETIRNSVEEYCQGVKLGQTPRWLAKQENLERKIASTIVLAFVGSVTFSDLGGNKIFVGNRCCTLTKFVEFGAQTQCTNCQKFGHPKEFCKDNPNCAVCAMKHSTEKHECSQKLCKGGYRCLHGSLSCVNCLGPHRACNHNCPVRVKISQEFREILKSRVLLPQN
jgi:hypothetical protein